MADISEYPVIVLTRKAFDDLYEYSTSLPTGTTVGKQWKRHIYELGSGGRMKLTNKWLMGEYFDDGTPGMIAIRWSRIEIDKLDLVIERRKQRANKRRNLLKKG